MKVAVRIIISSVVALILFLVAGLLSSSVIGGLASSSGWPLVYSRHCYEIEGYEYVCGKDMFNLLFVIVDYLVWFVPVYLILGLSAKRSKIKYSS